MRFIVYGAGAIGGVIGGRLAEHGSDVVLIARGAHAEAIADAGLTIESPQGTSTIRVPVVTDPSEITFRLGDVVILAVKSQDTASVLTRLRHTMPPTTPVVCAQNGVGNERAALRLFPNVIGMNVMCPATHLEPGVVQAFTTPVSGILDIGRYPSGVDDACAAFSESLEKATFVSLARPDIMRWKYTKLLMNLGNAIEALCGPAAARGPLFRLLRDEGMKCLQAANIDYVPQKEDVERRGDLLQLHPIGDKARGGGSTWQSVVRGTGSIETDHLNGEIVLLGRLHGVATPGNELMQELMFDMTARGLQPGTLTTDTILERLAQVTPT